MHNTISSVVDFIVGMVRPERIILFGSMAEQRHNRYSDMDLIVVIKDIENRCYYVELVESFIHRLSLKSDVLVHSTAEIEGAEKYSFLAEAVQTGRVLYG